MAIFVPSGVQESDEYLTNSAIVPSAKSLGGMNSMTKLPRSKTIRALLLGWLALNLIYVAFQFNGHFWMDGVLGEAQHHLWTRQHMDHRQEWSSWFWLTFALSIGGGVGAWFEKRWGDITLTIAIVLSLLYVDPVVQHAAQALLAQTMRLICGILVAAIWLMPRMAKTPAALAADPAPGSASSTNSVQLP